MLRIPLDDGTEYQVYFEHRRDDSPECTVCIILRGDKGLKREEMKQIGRGYAELSRKDFYDKNVGRKIALTRALQDARISKSERRDLFWSQYQQMRGEIWG